MDNLIAELERATEGSRELDGEIALSLGWVKHHAGWAHWTTPRGLENQHVPFFSQSLDAALTLVPVSAEKYRMCTLLELYSDGTGNASVVPFVDSQIWSGKRATPALALCIAALRARQAMEENQ